MKGFMGMKGAQMQSGRADAGTGPGRAATALLLSAFAAAACTPSLAYTTETPPLILTATAAAAVEDGRARFREIYCAVRAERGKPGDPPCEQSLHRLQGEGPPTGRPVHLGRARLKLRIRIVPGIFGECAAHMATPFQDAIEPLAKLGYDDVAAFEVDGRSSSARNAVQIARQIGAMNLKPDERLVLIGHSKGMSDILELIGDHESAVPKGSTIVSLTGVVAGTPIADRGAAAYRAIGWIPFPRCPVGDRRGVESLTRKHRLAYLAAHKLPSGFHYYSIPAFTRASNISSFLKPTYAALARFDARNDGNVIFHDSVIPGSTLLGHLNADHWAVAMPFEIFAPRRARLFASRNTFPRPLLLEAIARKIEEDYLGKAKLQG